ncbi:TMEM175 family protein [Streptantibioticus silvisoli]|uniref:TMEM175 family protein n=1 Tax=Streptantibioticus silvisoli TaxID=2705255 RepID=A0ABT6VV22_9ACTN|nr:TMEM175 family protein [Streptantibioticus silvisoli]MDI5962317.1 TMEM175 family protein [Streptantibioticus silvisoli]
MSTAKNEQALQARATDRMILFSDAVVAIAITLLALELPVPAGHDVSAFWRSVRENDGHYLAFLISFAVIAASWSQHHRVFSTVKLVDPRVRLINLFWLLMIVLNPFATKLLTTEGHGTVATHALRFGFYSLLQVLASGALIAMSRHLAAHHLLDPGSPAPSTTLRGERLYGTVLGFGLSIPVFFATTYAWVLWIVVPLLAERLPLRTRPPENGSPDA